MADNAEPTSGVIRAVSERLLLSALREQEGRFAAERLATERGAVLAQLADGVVTVDFAGCVMFANVAARQLDGALQPGREIIGSSVGRHLRAPDGRPFVAGRHPVVRALRGETVIGAEARVIRADGAEITIRLSAAPLSSEDGQRLGAIVTLRDTAAEREAVDLNGEPDFASGDIAIQFQRRRVTLRGQVVALTPIEYRLLALLIRNAGQVLSARVLLDRIWSAGATDSTGYLKVYIHRLRRKVEPAGAPHCIESVRGIGYRFVRPSPQPAWLPAGA